MKVVVFVLFGLVCSLCGCMAPSAKRTVKPPEVPVAVPEGFDLWEPCDTVRAEAWRSEADGNAAAALRGAACYAYLVERGGGESAEAAAGKQLAERAVAAYPHSAEAHYLLGYLAGLVARHSPLKALNLVPVIEREALAALDLNPEIDQAGPARMLGELYLRAPAFPVSLGDTALAVDYFRQAVELAPEQPDNRLGLIEALLAEDLAAEACRQLQHFWQGLTPDDAGDEIWKRGLELQGRMCEDLPED